jgi:hypothetical protein
VRIKIRLSYIVTRWRQHVTFPNHWITHEKGVAGRLCFFFCFISSMMDGGWMVIVVMGVEIVCVHLITFTFYNCLILLSIAEECFLYSGCATQSIGWRNPDF